jgi:peptide/nickel transport system ATP-binding protein
MAGSGMDITALFTPPSAHGEPALEAINVKRYFRLSAGGFRRSLGHARTVHAVDGVSIALYPGHVTALVGESGSGKSTVARLLAKLYPLTEGTIRLHGQPVGRVGRRRYRNYVRKVQMVFQDPFASFNPLHSVGYHLARPLKIHGYVARRRDVTTMVGQLLAEVNLAPAALFADKYPHELSGGQLQRVAVARALAARPTVLLADEPVSMLDVSVRLGVLNLLVGLTRERNLALLYITHDIASARYFAGTTLVMYAGQLVEGGPSEAITQRPAHPYTQLLISSAPNPDDLSSRSALGAKAEPPSAISPPTGCRFHPRCPHAMAICAESPPPQVEPESGHWVKCWLHVPAPR